MSEEIRAISDGHLAVEEAMETLISLVQRIRQMEAVNDHHGEELRQQTAKLAEALEEHIEVGHSNVDELSEAVLGERPCEVEELDAGSKRFLSSSAGAKKSPPGYHHTRWALRHLLTERR